MNIKHLIDAVEAVDKAAIATFDVPERARIHSIACELRELLRKRGVFVGVNHNPADAVQQVLKANS